MRSELALKEKKGKKIEKFIHFFVILIVVLIITFCLYQANEQNKKDEVEKIADLASQYKVSGKVEKITRKILDNDGNFQLFSPWNTVEYYVWVNSKKYKLPDDFIGTLQKGNQVTLVGDRKGVSSIEMEVSNR